MAASVSIAWQNVVLPPGREAFDATKGLAAYLPAEAAVPSRTFTRQPTTSPARPPGPAHAADLGTSETERETRLHAWYGDTISRMHGEMHSEIIRLTHELSRVNGARDADRRAVEAACTDQLAVCHCDAVATLEAVLAPVQPLLARVRDELRADAQVSETHRTQLLALVRGFGADDAALAPSSALPLTDGEWRERFEALKRLLRAQAEDGEAGHSGLLGALRAATDATASAVAQAEAQARAMLSVVRSLWSAQQQQSSQHPGGAEPMLSALYLAAANARGERNDFERQVLALKEQLAVAKRQSAVQSRCLQAKIDEAQVHRHNSERMRKHVARAAEREAELRATHAEAQRAAAKREQALAQRLARSQRAAPSAEPGRTPVAGARARTAQNGGGGGGSCEDSDAAAAGGAQEGGSGGGSGASFQDLDAAIEQAELAVREARFDLHVEAELRQQLQAKNAQLASRLVALEAAMLREPEHAPARRAPARADEPRAARGGLTPAAKPHAHSTPSAGELATPQPRASNASASTSAPAPAPASAYSASPYDEQTLELELGALVERLCAKVPARADGQVDVADLGAFLVTVNTLQPIGHEPHAKAAALCRDFGDGASITAEDFRKILTKLAKGRAMRLMQLSNAWDSRDRSARTAVTAG